MLLPLFYIIHYHDDEDDDDNDDDHHCILIYHIINNDDDDDRIPICNVVNKLSYILLNLSLLRERRRERSDTLLVV